MSLFFLLAYRWAIALINSETRNYDGVVDSFGDNIYHHLTTVTEQDEDGEWIDGSERSGVATVIARTFGSLAYEYTITTLGVESTIDVTWYHNGNCNRDDEAKPSVPVKDLLRMLRMLDESIRRSVKDLPGLPIISYGLWFDDDGQMDRRISLYKRWAERIESDGIAIVDVAE